MSDEPIDQARAEAAEAKARMIGAARALQVRLQPATLAHDAWAGIRDRGELAVEKATHFAKARPVAVSAAAIGLIGLFMRRPIARLFGGIARRSGKSARVVTSERTGAKP